MKREGQTAIREYVNLYLSGSTESWNRKANFNKQQSCAVCGAHYTVPLLYFVTVLKSWTFDPNCDDESSSAHVCQCIGHRFSNSSFQPLRSGLPWLFLPSLGKDVKLTLCLNTHTHSTPTTKANIIPCGFPICPHSPVIFAEGSLTLIIDVSRNPLESQVTPLLSCPWTPH